MRSNAAAAVQAGHGLDLLLKNLLALRQELAANGKRLELHVAGHSAGSILLGHLLSLAGSQTGSNPPLAVKSTTLFAAACSCEFANQHYMAAQAKGVLKLSDLCLYVLADENEKADALPSPALPAYGKSLLYLVSRALDDVRKMPLLGMQRAQLQEYENDADQWDEGQLPEVHQWRSA
jgi:hypothetical protein